MMDDNAKQALMNHLTNDVTFPMKGSDLSKVCDNWSDVPDGAMHAAKLMPDKMYDSKEDVMMDLGMDMGGDMAGKM